MTLFRPAWELETPDGDTVSSRDVAGQVVVMDFWSWCPFCRANLPSLDQLTRDMRRRGVRVLAVQMWDETDPVAFLETEGVELDVLLGGDALAERFLISVTPTAFVIGRDGTILHRENGSGAERGDRLR